MNLWHLVVPQSWEVQGKKKKKKGCWGMSETHRRPQWSRVEHCSHKINNDPIRLYPKKMYPGAPIDIN